MVSCFWWTVVAGPLLRLEPVFGEMQEEQFSGIRWNVVTRRIAAIEWEPLSEEERCRRQWNKLSHSFNKSYSR